MFDANLLKICVNTFEIKLMAANSKLSAWLNFVKIKHRFSFQEFQFPSSSLVCLWHFAFRLPYRIICDR